MLKLLGVIGWSVLSAGVIYVAFAPEHGLLERGPMVATSVALIAGGVVAQSRAAQPGPTGDDAGE